MRLLRLFIEKFLLFHHLHSNEIAQNLLYVLFVNMFHCL